ncbi:hypothetical protein F4802DRAFT_583174 [Xylaria palmicola]|nr:hypothetical protein F4802DRAFT_583174 [Xylaria palmicola]
MDSSTTQIELNQLQSLSACQTEPHIKVCPWHSRRFQEVVDNIAGAHSQAGIKADFQAWNILATMKNFQSLFADIKPLESAVSTACWYLEVVLALQEHLSAPRPVTWDSATDYLRTYALLREEQNERLTLSHYFVFCLIGPMTSLYYASNPGNREGHDWRDFEIQSICVSTSHKFWCYFDSVLLDLSFHGPVSNFLAGFGDVLPLADGEGRTVVDEEALWDPRQFNADVLQRALKMQIIWTDILGAHLDFDSVTNTVYLFRQASQCLLNSGELDRRYTPLQSCVVDGIADEERIKDLMKEILLSLYIIYGQSPKSQRCFNEDDAFGSTETGPRDELLQEICRGRWRFRSFQQRPKRVYNIRSDFPILGAKVLFISKQVRLQEPTSLAQLWRDKRNTLQWWTFWAVIVFGTIGTILAAIQTIIAGLQLNQLQPPVIEN